MSSGQNYICKFEFGQSGHCLGHDGHAGTEAPAPGPLVGIESATSLRGSTILVNMGKGGAAASQEAAQDIVKPLTFDGVVFKHLRLSNNIEFLLVSDPELDKAGASVDVRVGSLSDPEDVPGLAHFLGDGFY